MVASGLLRNLDWHVHLCWLQGFHDGLTQGAWYPRWIDGANEGQGGPVFLYYAPLAYYLGSGFMALGAHVATALKAVYLLSLLLCAGGLYAWLRPICGRTAAVALAGFGLLTPQLTVFAYSYNMPASALAIGVLPWIGWALERRGALACRIACLAVALAVLLVSHTLTGFQVLLLLALWGVAALFLARARSFAVRVLLPSTLLALAMAAIYLLPLVAARDLIHAEHLIDSPQWQIVSNLQFDWLFGGAPAGHGAIEFDFANGCALLALGLVVWRFAGRDSRITGNEWMPWACTALLVFLLMTPLCAWLYESVEILRYLQFGWRWQALFLLCVLRVFAHVFRESSADCETSVLECGVAQASATHALGGSVAVHVAFGIAMAACAVGIVVCQLRIVQPFSERVVSQRVGPAEADRFAQRCAWPMLEYRPRGMGAAWRRELTHLPRRPVALSGRAHIVAADVDNETKRYEIVADVPSRIVFPILGFPGWTAMIGAAPAEHAQTLPDGRIAVELMRGRQQVVLRFEPVPEVRTGSIISVVAALLWFGVLGWGTLRTHRARRRFATVRTG